MIGLTPTQACLLRYIAARGPNDCPSYAEMCEYMDLKSKSGIHRLISALEERGYLRRIPNRKRCLEVLPQTEGLIGKVTTREIVKELQYRGYVVKLRKIKLPEQVTA